MDRNYLREIWRLLTFWEFPRNATSSTILLARQGFVYIGQDDAGEDMVKCVFCLSLTVVCNFEGTNITDHHSRLNASCPIVRGVDCGNVLIGQSDEPLFAFYRERHYPAWNGHNHYSVFRSDRTVGQGLIVENDPPQAFTPSFSSTLLPHQGLAYGHASQPNLAGNPCIQVTDVDATSELVTSQAHGSMPFVMNSQPGTLRGGSFDIAANTSNSREMAQNPLPQREYYMQRSLSNDFQPDRGGATGRNINDIGIIPRPASRYEFYADKEKRLSTFAMWTFGHYLKPEDLAKAGYFYAGYSDCVRCFYCDLGFRSWGNSVDPWVAHVKYRPHCAFLQVVLGKAFIDVALFLIRESGPGMVLYEDVIAEMKARHLDREIPEGVQFKIGPRQAIRCASDEGDDVATCDKSQATAENQRLREQTRCKVCCTEKASALILPCAHLLVCTECAFSLAKCPECRKPITGLYRVNLS